ncbi:MAG: DeoR/GlpR family DNA-binding transcription regulator [Spirochaetales bacterium]|uniref:DeoR/GlpR family DNA-binding transcription regulator n=1 Tax=Candidatus Thalassospirochaeta sargassi TaxID=3119039 RepID=A0AAJ1ICV2_9SPIO|nr:DeoR/GlpR family DNA-binding transcription regulator [Spirochaetales bacterium]
MSQNPRHDQILVLIRKFRKISVQELTRRMDVSTVTIRKDLSFLEEQGLLIRTHGGAMLAENRHVHPMLAQRLNSFPKQKEAVARAASDLITDGDTVYLDAGSTPAELAKLMKGRDLRVLTNSLEVMNILSGEPGIALVSVGGNYRREAGSYIGPLAEDTLRQFRMDVCFLGCSAFDETGSFSSQNIIETRLKKVALSVSRLKIILTDSSKFEAEAFSIFAEKNDIDILYTDSGFTEQEQFQRLGIEVVAAG